MVQQALERLALAAEALAEYRALHEEIRNPIVERGLFALVALTTRDLKVAIMIRDLGMGRAR
jgi:hypothetical protein